MSKKILAIDDDSDILNAIQYTLEDAGYKVKTSEKGENAENLHGTKNGLPNLIILDVLLSGKDGRDICKKLKSQKETKHIPIIMISANPHAKESSIEVGANDFLSKPFDIDNLIHMIEKYIK